MFQSARSATWLPVISNTLLVLLKLGVGIAIGSISVISDGLDSLIDTTSAFIALVAVRIAARPADTGHPFGHGKAENLGVLVEALFITAGGIFITVEAIRRILAGAELGLVELGIGVMGFSIILNLVVSAHLLRVARHTGSPALAAAGRHRATDVVTSGGVLLGLILVRTTGVQVLDPVVALVIAVIIFWTAAGLLRSSFEALMDVRLSPEEEAQVRALINRYQDQARLAHLHTRKAGPDRYFELTLMVCQHMSVGESHHLTEHFEEQIYALFPGSTVVIHIEPCDLHPELPCPAACAASRGVP